MTERSIFECDGCGDRHGHRTEMWGFDVVYPRGPYEPPRRETLHVCMACGPDGISGVLSGVHSFRVTKAPDAPNLWKVIAIRTDNGERLPREKADALEGMATGEVASLDWIEKEVL